MSLMNLLDDVQQRLYLKSRRSYLYGLTTSQAHPDDDLPLWLSTASDWPNQRVSQSEVEHC